MLLVSIDIIPFADAFMCSHILKLPVQGYRKLKEF